jgi:DNA modification methylase
MLHRLATIAGAHRRDPGGRLHPARHCRMGQDVATWPSIPRRFQAAGRVHRVGEQGRDVYLPGVFPCALDMPKKHLTEKPVDLAREVVKLVPEGGVVCDLFAGSGTFLVAAKEAGLRWMGCEANDVYYDVAANRLGIV